MFGLTRARFARRIAPALGRRCSAEAAVGAMVAARDYVLERNNALCPRRSYTPTAI